MSEATRQRWLFGVIGVVGLVVGLLELRNIRSEERLVALTVLMASVFLGFGVMWLRELYLRRSGKQPAGKPSDMSAIQVAALGAIVVVRLLSPILSVAVYGLGAGLMAGAFLFVPRDLQRLSRHPNGPTE